MPIGRVVGHRGLSGELTVRVGSGDAAIWHELRRVAIESTPEATRLYEVEHVRTYRDRLVLKLRGIDDASAAAALKGARVTAPAGAEPKLPAGEYFAAGLVGLAVVDETGHRLGVVRDVVPTGGADLLLVGGDDGAEDEWMVPMAREIVRQVDTEGGRLVVRLPEGLRYLNRPEKGSQS